MDIQLIYNEYSNKFNINIDNSIGFIQEEILKFNNLII